MCCSYTGYAGGGGGGGGDDHLASDVARDN